MPIDEFNELRKAAGLPISKFGYKGDKVDKEDDNNKKEKDSPAEKKNTGDDDDNDTAEPEKPAFAENMVSGSAAMVDLPDDGFSMPGSDDEE